MTDLPSGALASELMNQAADQLLRQVRPGAYRLEVAAVAVQGHVRRSMKSGRPELVFAVPDRRKVADSIACVVPDAADRNGVVRPLKWNGFEVYYYAGVEVTLESYGNGKVVLAEHDQDTPDTYNLGGDRSLEGLRGCRLLLTPDALYKDAQMVATVDQASGVVTPLVDWPRRAGRIYTEHRTEAPRRGPWRSPPVGPRTHPSRR